MVPYTSQARAVRTAASRARWISAAGAPEARSDMSRAATPTEAMPAKFPSSPCSS